MKGAFLITGTGGSMGIPVIGCSCDVCCSDNARNQRMRSGCLVSVNSKKILIDAGPELRQQALAFGIDSIDALFITHAHQDHVAGLDDLRPFFFRGRGPVPCYLLRETYEDLAVRFGYIFKPGKETGTLLPKFSFEILEEDRGRIDFEGIKIKYLTFSQAGMKVNGYRFGDLAYISDIKEYPDSIFDDLAGVKTLIVSALRKEPNPIHFTVDEAVAFAEKTEAEKTWLTHIAHELDHDKTNASLPENIRMAYDGLELNFTM
jgi:phosphoribosyl 1,2-cyclic phosphate phosphodiesterase